MAEPAPLRTLPALAALSAPRPLLRAPLDAQMQEIRRVAEEFEGMVLAELLQPAFSALDTDGLGGGGDGEQMFRPMLVERYAQSMAKAGGVGLADAIVAELQRLQTIQAQPTEDRDGADR
ncbi:MAG: chemotaxis protein chel [Alphaproteobacteria bacterium]|nr:chemotaxis protein chel [Alphaproteobacteria bacterium]